MKIILFLILATGLVFFLSYLSKNESANIKNIDIFGNSVTHSQDVLEIANKNIEGNYLGLFSKRNFLLYPKSKIKKDILNAFLRIETVNLARESFANFQSIKINITERKPDALYCDYLASELPDVEECYFMDENAFIFDRAPTFSENVYFKYYGGDVSTTTENKIVGQTFLASAPTGQFEKVNLLIRYLKDINIDVYKLTVKKNGDYELYFDKESKLIFDEKQDFGIILENLRAVLIDLGDLEGKEFEYIDLRFNNKIPYKFRE
ncbi:MAG: hypothetical protein ABIG87_03200 [Patescibacteria group bacterium]